MQANDLFDIRPINMLWNPGVLYKKVKSGKKYDLIIITNGSGQVKIDMHFFDVKNQQVFCVAPSQLYQIHISEETAGYRISIDEDIFQSGNTWMNSSFLNGLLYSLSAASCLEFDTQSFTEINSIIKGLLSEYEKEQNYRDEMLLQYLNIVFLYLTRKCKVNEIMNSNHSSRLFNKYISLIEKNFKTCKRVAEYAEQMCLTSNYLNQLVRATTGHTASYYIRQRIVQEAQRHAMYSGLSMKELAYQLGFEDIAHFSRFFKKETGNNFSDFRKNVSYPMATA